MNPEELLALLAELADARLFRDQARAEIARLQARINELEAVPEPQPAPKKTIRK